MASKERNRRRWELAALLALALAAGGAGRPLRQGGPVDAAAPDAAAPTADSVTMGGGDWAAIDALIGEQKYQAAAQAVAVLRQRAAAAGATAEWTRALVREGQLTAALGGVEGAVRLLQETPWPDTAEARTALRLLYADSLARYLDVYGWEIRQREQVGGDAGADLRQWTAGQVEAAIDDAYRELWVERAAWGADPLGELAPYFERTDYPERIRGTLRDAVTYLWVEFLADTSHWQPAQEQGIYRLDLAALLSPDAGVPEDGHPLQRLAGSLADLARWHAAGERPEAAFEARLELLRRLAASFPRNADRARLRAALEGALEALGESYPWWSVGQAQLAQLVEGEGEPDSLTTARDLARRGMAAHPESVGGRRCASLVAALESPQLELQAMQSDGAGQRSLLLRHKKLERAYFRAYPLDLEATVTRSRDYNLLPTQRRVEALLAGGPPAHEWSVDLPPTPDLAMHQTYVTPPLAEPGLYVVAVSAREDFATAGNGLQAVDLVVSDLVVLARPRTEGLDVDVRSGATGAGLAGVEVGLWRLDYRGGHRLSESGVTGPDGRLRLTASATRNENAMVFARRGDDTNFERAWVAPREVRQDRDSTRSLIYTDRSIYRPGQDVLWKVVAYERSERRRRLAAAADRKLRLELLDANWEPVAASDVTTNDFGSAAGRFTIPPGRLLGAWHLRTSADGSADIQVEEYKRPTFEVTLGDAAGELRLNRPARLGGEARYYFGLPVVDGTVRWQVARRPRYPEWWGWFRQQPQRGEELVAVGESALDAEGGFELEFTPEADEREAAEGVTYAYAVSVDVTDSGGETRSAERSYRLGYVAVEAEIHSQRGYFAADEAPAFEIVRRDLDGAPRPGDGRWRLVTLRPPAEAALPADVPLPEPRDGGYVTPGDRMRPRWSVEAQPAARLREWPEGETVGAGALRHDAEGVARVALDRLAPGAHRLIYETEDSFGARFETRREFVVAGDAPLPLPLFLVLDRATVPAGDSARLLVGSGLPDQEMLLEIARPGRELEERRLRASGGLQEIVLPISEADGGGVQVRLSVLRDHQWLMLPAHLSVPPPERDLDVRFESFRDRLRPGSRERWRLVVGGADEGELAAGAAEVLAYMYDRSLDLFAEHRPPRPAGFAEPAAQLPGWNVSLGVAFSALSQADWPEIPGFPYLRPDRLRFFDDYPIGGPGRRGGLLGGARAAWEPGAMMALEKEATAEVPQPAPAADASRDGDRGGAVEGRTTSEEPPRSDFSETAFWEPHLVTDADGAVAFEFTVPDSVTEWNVWVHALTRDLRYGVLQGRARTVKELLVRPYLPRFLREGDAATVRIVVQNAGDEALNGTLDFDLRDPQDDTSRSAEFGVEDSRRLGLPFAVEPGGSATLEVALRVPPRVGTVAVRVVGRAGAFSDGEVRALPVLPGRFHLVQSRFAALHDAARRELTFADLAADDDPTRIDEQLVVTLDAQLFYSVLGALPYLVDYPYECTEQTLNRFLSSGIVGSVFDRYPAVARVARELARRDTPLEPWALDDPNRRMALEETPWLAAAAGGETEAPLLRILDPRVARAQRDRGLRKLRNAQTSLGGFPWWPGGPPSPYMTAYVVGGLARALEFGIEVPREMVAEAWSYLHRYYVDELDDVLDGEAGDGRKSSRSASPELVTLLDYVLSSYPDASWTGGVFSDEDRRRMLDFSFAHWRGHSPLLKSYLALTLHRAGRDADARLVFDSVMDSARTTEDEGTFWTPEERAWLWYNDTVEGHALALRTLGELDPDDPRQAGLVQWLMLDKKLGHWKSTRATAEVIYSLVHYLDAAGELGGTETARVTLGGEPHDFVFTSDEYTGRDRRIALEGAAIDPAAATVVVEKDTPGLLFASVTWHFSTEELPAAAAGDFFSVERRYFKRLRRGDVWHLEPLAEDVRLVPGDEVEVQLELRSRQAAEYVHLRDPRAAGFEPESLTSGYRWDLGIGWYEQVRDSGTDFFFDWLPAGEYTFHYRLRANLGGVFKAAPATVQSMYAPEFAAYSNGATLTIAPR